MTTIAYDGRYIAIDSRITSHNTHIVSDKREKFVDVDDWILFWCGATINRNIFIESFFNGKEIDNDLNFGMYGFQKSTMKVYEIGIDESRIFKSELVDYAATGHGGDHALTAMDCGKSAVEAIKLAAKRDACTGGVIHCLDTHTGKFIKVKQ